MNWLAIVVAAVVQMALGAFWYSPAGFGKQWMKEMKYTDKDIDKAKARGMGKYYLAAFIGTLVTSAVLALFVSGVGADTVGAGALTAFWLWLGFIVPVLLGSVLWEQKSVRVYIIGVAYHLVALLVMGSIIGGWQ
ncbi:MAG TPA: DUF1761 domain-containing protein [Candidatus Nanoarchaeia archaeon]|nr:DUF1761 domain-containing protein [Candidatus Nanoarchaeia archaeon]